MATAAVGLFAVAPRLVDVTYAGPAKALQDLPWKQLQRFEYPDLHHSELSGALSVLQYFPPSMHFELRRLMSLPTSLTEGLALVPQPVVSDLTDLTVEFAWHTSGAMADTLQRLTLPSLSSLEVAVVSPYKWNPPVVWNQMAFHRFCMRSESYKTLRTLFLLHVAITPADLYECLSELKVLREFVVADHPAVGDTPEHVLLTDQVFRRLAERSLAEHSPAPRLIPELAVFGCLSLLRFDEAVYLDFVRSRVDHRKGSEFESHIRWHSSSARELNPAVSEELQRLSKEQGFMGSIDAANEQEMQTFFY
jgi:hypothetical protein